MLEKKNYINKVYFTEVTKNETGTLINFYRFSKKSKEWFGLINNPQKSLDNQQMKTKFLL